MKTKYFIYGIPVVLLLPFSLLCFFTYPGLEDYAQAMLSQYLGVLGHFKELYFTFDGRFFVALLYAINPLVEYHFQIYKLLPLLHFILIFLALYYLSKQIFQNLNQSFHILSASFLMSMALYDMPSLPAAFYYMVSAMVYFTPMVMLLFLSLFILKMYKSKKGLSKLLYLFLASILIIATLGCNEMYLILLPFILTSMVFYHFLKYSTDKSESLILLFALACGLFIHLTAPGIQSHFTAQPIEFNLDYTLKQLTTSIWETIFHTLSWLKKHYLLWAASLLYIPFGLKLAQQNIFFKKFKPYYLLFSLICILVYLILPLPYYWALGQGEGDNPERIFNVVYFCFPFLWFLILQTALNFFRDKSESNPINNHIYLLSGIIFIVSLPFSNNWITAINDLISGDAIEYHKEMLARFKLFETHNKNEVVKLDTLKHKPKTIFSGFDLQKNRSGGWNEVYEDYFKVGRIELEGDKPIKKEIFSTEYISKSELQKNFLLENIPVSNVDSAIKFGLFVPKDFLCGHEVTVHPPVNFDWLNLQNDLNIGGIDGLIKVTNSLYQVFADTRTPQNIAYQYEDLIYDSILSNLKSGYWAPQCGGISLMTAKIINDIAGNNYQAKAIHLDAIEHDMCLVNFNNNEHSYAVIIDAQNGIIGPFLKENNQIVDISSLTKTPVRDLSLYHLPDSILIKKRNLYEEIPSCNFFPIEVYQYHFSHEIPKYRFEVMSYSLHYHLWFKNNLVSTDSLILDIKKKILLNQTL